MTAESEEYRALVQAEIAHHLRVHGPKNWELLRDKHPSINERTFFRWVKSVRERGVVPDAIPLAAKQARTESMKHVPVAPAPEYLAREGAQGVRQIDFLVALGELYRDAEMLKAFAGRPAKDGEEGLQIKNPILWDSSIKRRLDIIQNAIKTMEAIYDLERMRKFYDLIIEEIGKASPEVQQAIMIRLAALNAEHGLTIHAGV